MSWPEQKSPKVAKLYTAEGMDALAHAHPIFSQLDLLVIHLFPKLDWEDCISVERVCKKWRLWWRLCHLAFCPSFVGPYAAAEWILNDILFNSGRDFHAWMTKDMTVYFDGCPLLFKED